MSGIKGKTGVYKRTEETRKRMSLASKRRKLSEETKRKIGLKSKGNKYRLGAKMPLEARKKIGEFQRNRKCSKETRLKMSLASKGKPKSEEHKQKLRILRIGSKNSAETRLKISNSLTGKEHKKGKFSHAYKGGMSTTPYPIEFNKKLKRRIRERDNFTCCLCGKTEREELEEFNRVLSINHIDFNKKNCAENNLNTLCCRCNTKINRDREHWTEYFNNL